MYEQLVKNLWNTYFEYEMDSFNDDYRFTYIAVNDTIATIYEIEGGVEVVIEFCECTEDGNHYHQLDSKIYHRLAAAEKYIVKMLG